MTTARTRQLRGRGHLQSGLVRQPGLRREQRPSGERLDAIASTRGWAWPLCSAAIALVSVTALAAVHRQIDLGTYLLGGAHVLQSDLYRVTYEPTGLGFTYPPFAALWFAPLAHLPVRLGLAPGTVAR